MGCTSSINTSNVIKIESQQSLEKSRTSNDNAISNLPIRKKNLAMPDVIKKTPDQVKFDLFLLL